MSKNTVESILGPDIVSQEKLGEVSRSVDYDDHVKVFYSSGGSKQIGFTPGDLDVLASGFEQTFRAAGVVSDDVAVNWGAPEGTPHMSRWCFTNGMSFIDDVVNNSVADDFEDYKDSWDDVTVLQSMPRMLKSIGEEIEGEYGSITDIFPNLRMSITAGDVMSESLRDWIETKYEINAVNFYAGTEMGAVAAEVEPEVYRLTNPNIEVEILNEEADVGGNGEISEDDIYDLRELRSGQEVRGTILFSASHREALPFTRYRVGDVWNAWGTENGPRMSFEGREDNVILYSGANLYPEEVDEAVRTLADQDWKLVVAEEDDAVCLNFYLPDKYIDEIDLAESIAEQNDTFNVWRDTGSGTATGISSQTFDSWVDLERSLEERYELPRDEEGDIELVNDLRGKTLKRKRMAFDQSYIAGNHF